MRFRKYTYIYVNLETCLPVKVVLIFFLRPAPPKSSVSSSPTGSLWGQLFEQTRAFALAWINLTYGKALMEQKYEEEENLLVGSHPF